MRPFTIIVSLILTFPVIGQTVPDVQALLKEVQANEERVESLLDTYSYVQKITNRKVDKKGVLREVGSETWQLSFFKGYRIKRLIEKNGKPLNAKDQAEEDKKAAKRVAEIEKKIADKEKDNEPDKDSRISITELLKASRLSNPRRERLFGREMTAFDFEPDPDYELNNASGGMKFFSRSAGVIWIDTEDKQVVKIDGHLAENFGIGGGVFAKLKKGSTFRLEQTRVGGEIWLPAKADINISAKLLLLKGASLDQLIQSYDYQKFSSEVKKVEVTDVAKP